MIIVILLYFNSIKQLCYVIKNIFNCLSLLNRAFTIFRTDILTDIWSNPYPFSWVNVKKWVFGILERGFGAWGSWGPESVKTRLSMISHKGV